MKIGYKKTVLGIIFITLASFLIFSFAFVESIVSTSNYYGTQYNEDAYNFQLINSEGEKMSLNTLKGYYVYLFFGYTSCYPICSRAMSTLLALSKEIPFYNVKFVFITLDPQRDTKDVLNNYIRNYGNKFVALYENEKLIREVASRYNCFFSKEIFSSNQNYEINHNSFIYLIDANGVLRLIYTSPHLDSEKMFNDLKLLRKEKNYD